MILSDFRYQDPWAKEKFTLPDFIRQSQAKQRQDQQARLTHQHILCSQTHMGSVDYSPQSTLFIYRIRININNRLVHVPSFSSNHRFCNTWRP